MAALPAVVRSHYDDVGRIAEDVKSLGYIKAAAVLAERMPRSKRARSGELGEILATELVEEQLGYRVPIRRLRYKDGREMALRGDDFIGIKGNSSETLAFAKGESKSRQTLGKDAISDARSVLSRDAGRPTPTSILFVADRLMDLGGDEETLGRTIRNEVANRAIPSSRIEHNLFEALVQNGPPDDVARGFNRIMGAAAYHLAGYSALAFSLISQGAIEGNFAPAERAIASLLLRDLSGLSLEARTWLLNAENSDDEISRRLESQEIDPDDAITSIITSTIYRAFAFFHFALQTGQIELAEQASSLLRTSLSIL